MTYFLLYAYLFILGITVGSFLNVCIYRLPRKLGIAKGFSYCPTCKHRLMPVDLFPLLSYVFLKGKCRYCHESISLRYPFVELLGGVSFLLAFLRFGVSWELIPCLFMLCICIVVAFIDIDTMEILDGTHFFIIALAVIQIFITKASIQEHLIAALIVSLPLALIAWLSHGGIGGGDVKLMATCGLYLGFSNIILAAVLGILSGGLYAGYLLIVKKKSGKAHMALGPFLVFGVAMAMLYGSAIMNWYFNLFF